MKEMPDISILHISDIHRTPSAPVSNTELISSLFADAQQYSLQDPKINDINAIICSGDLVQGIKLNDSNYPESLQVQYDECYEFLSKLAETFLKGDRSKIVLVPGNHDVDWKIAFNSMEEVKYEPKKLKDYLKLKDHRWDWNTLKLYRIKDKALYSQKLEKFSTFYEKFYAGHDVDYVIKPEFKYSIHKLTENIILAGLNSCDGNDCFDYSGNISPETISDCHMHLEKNYSHHSTRIAVWHHDFHGPPKRTDYMDSGIIDLLFSKGFRIGLHGHQHKSETHPFHQYFQNKEIMTIISAGSLTAGQRELPQGYNRQYNIVELCLENAQARVHIREMLTNGCFTSGRHIHSGGKSFADLNWTKSMTNNTRSPLTLGTNNKIQIMERVEKFISDDDFKSALSILDESLDILGNYGHRLKVKCLEGLEDWGQLEKLITNPTNEIELGLLIKAHTKLGLFEKTDHLLQEPQTLELIGQTAINEFKRLNEIEKSLRNKK